MKLQSILFSIMMMGCGVGKTPILEIDKDYSPEEVQQIVKGSEQWESHPELGIHYSTALLPHHTLMEGDYFRGAYHHSIRILRSKSHQDCPMYFPDVANGRTNIDYVSGDAIICVEVDLIQLKYSSLSQVIAHELGHCLNLDHPSVNGPPSVMKYRADYQAHEVSDYDVQSALNAE